jgi:glycosyltransferase involved in cell wall biosynthesis
LESATAWSPGPKLRLLSVGRIDTEKNPLLLADVLRRLTEQDPRWKLVVCGEGPLEGELAAELERLGLSGAAELRGYVPHDQLAAIYRECDVLAHVSLTEGLPQVLFEAFASGLPVVATDVGGIAEAVGDAALLVPANDAEAMSEAVRTLAEDGEARRELVARAIALAEGHTIETETQRVAEFIGGS